MGRWVGVGRLGLGGCWRARACLSTYLSGARGMHCSLLLVLERQVMAQQGALDAGHRDS